MLSHIPNRPGEITLREMILAVKAISVLSCVLINIDNLFCEGQKHYVLVSGKPRTPIPGECGSLAGDFSGFKWSSLPQCAGCSTTLDTNNSDRGPLAGLAGLWRGFRFWIGLQRTLGKRMISKWRPPTRRYVRFKIHSFHACNGPSIKFCVQSHVL